MSRLLPLLMLFALPACSRPAPPPIDTQPSIVIAPEPAPRMLVNDGSIPPPRPIPLAAEACDPKGAIELFIVRRPNCSWRVQYPAGQRVLLAGPEAVLADADLATVQPIVLPIGRPVTLALSSDGGASPFGIPTFGITTEAPQSKWVHATVLPTRAGEFGIWSGREHVGSVVVVSAAEFDDWLAGTEPLPGTAAVGGSLAHQGRQLFLKLHCINCHSVTPAGKAPSLEGLYGSKVSLAGGGTVLVDDAYIRESIRKPRAKVVDGWESIMPAYEADQVTAEDLAALVAFVRSLRKKSASEPLPMGGPPAKRPTIHPDNPRWEDVERIKKKLLDRGFDPVEIDRLYPRPVAPPPRVAEQVQGDR